MENEDLSSGPNLEESSKIEPMNSRASLAWARIEDWAISISLGLMMSLPLLEIVLRRFNTSISGSAELLQHLVLFVAMLGGAIAARENRLLSLSTFTAFLTGSWAVIARSFSASLALFVTAVIGIGCFKFINTEGIGDETVFWGIPGWAVMAIMPIGFALLAIRIVWFSSPSWKSRWIPLVASAALIAFAIYPFEEVESFVWPLLILLILATVAGAPLYVAIGGTALIMNWGWSGYFPEERVSITIETQAQTLYGFISNPLLVTLPLFTLAGYFLALGHSSKRLIRLIQSIFGGVRGGAVIVTVLVCAFFTTFTGASGVTILALGGLLMPVLQSAGYNERSSIGMLTGAGSLGVLFPPCLPLILYAVVATNTKLVSLSLKDVFLGGAIPGALLVVMTVIWGIWKQPQTSVDQTPVDWVEVWKAFAGALGELFLPIVALFALFSGFATPIEAASVSAFYAFIVYLVDAKRVRGVSVRAELPTIMAECGLLVGGVLLILGVAMGLTDYLIFAMIPDRMVEWAQATIESKYLFLLALNGALILVGCLMDIFSAIIVIVPLIVPLGVVFGIDPIHLGIIFLANLQLGYLTPPIGMNLFLASYRFGKPMSVVIKASLPLLLVFVIGVILITYIPFLTTWLPSLLKN
ncbi:MAG: TRAP transporter large permease subunit [Verrucomicrobiota bacterium]|nr:TRAP transporter large permease subunit [Verrucomicrobiota bacterium]